MFVHPRASLKTANRCLAFHDKNCMFFCESHVLFGVPSVPLHLQPEWPTAGLCCKRAPGGTPICAFHSFKSNTERWTTPNLESKAAAARSCRDNPGCCHCPIWIGKLVVVMMAMPSVKLLHLCRIWQEDFLTFEQPIVPVHCELSCLRAALQGKAIVNQKSCCCIHASVALKVPRPILLCFHLFPLCNSIST
jgi:hypothetical protein